MLKTLSQLFTLRPYGDQLMDGTARIWLILAPLNIISIAFCDAIAWSYFAYTTMHGNAAYAAAAVAGLIVFTLVASVDAMFVMYDRSQRVPESEWRFGIRRDHIAIAARIVLVILTFTVTAPFLTQLFFARDIEAAMKNRNEQVISAKRQQLSSQLTARQRDLEKEIAGSGISGRYGKGPTAAAIESEVAALQTEVRTFDEAVRNPETLANRYGIDLVREGPGTRARVVAELEKSPAFRSTQRTIKAFLVFMFLGLVCLKLFQPESVRIYYSAQLQAAYARLKAGIFDHRIDPRELPASGGMTPVRFADWYENDQQVRDLTEKLRTQEDAVRVLHETLRIDMARIHEDLAAVAKTSDDLELQMLTSQRELELLNSRIAEEQQALDDFRYEFGDDLSLRDQQLLMSSRNKTIRLLAEHRAAAATLTAAMQRHSQRLEANRFHENQLRQALASTSSESAALSQALQIARQRRVSDILSP